MAKKFTITRKGYSVDEVDAFIAKLLDLTEQKLIEQTNRINELKEQLRTVIEEKNELKARENSVSVALSEAVKRADEIEDAAEVRYSLELQRIKQFRARFFDYVEKLKSEEQVQPDVQEYKNFLSELENDLNTVMRDELNMEKGVLPTMEEEIKPQEKVSEEDNGFNLQEALTPKETLEDICKELGLI